MSQIPRPALVAAITNVLRRGGIQEPQLMASMCATAVLDAISVFESIQNAPAPGSPDDLSADDFTAPARSPISLPQPVLESVPAPRPKLVIAPDQAKQEPPPVAIRPNRAGRVQDTGEKRNWIIADLNQAVISAMPASIEVKTDSGVLVMMRSVNANEGAYGSGGFVRVAYTASGGSGGSEVEGAVSLGPIEVAKTVTDSDPNPLDFKFILTDLTRKAEGIARTRSGQPVISRNPPTDDAAKSAFRSVTSDMSLPASQKKNQGNWEDADF